MERWAGCVALVTGGSIGIGAAIVRRLASHGIKVIACARQVDKIQAIEEEVKKSGAAGEVCPVHCDLRRESDIMDLFQLIRNKYGRLNVCINNAGLAWQNTLSEGNVEEWKEMLDVNVLALSICTKEAIKLMRECGVDDGHIIHMNSMAGHRVPSIHGSFYSATKHAVTALTEGLRRELAEAKSHIRVSSISPGYVDTDMVRRASSHQPESTPFIKPSLKILDAEDIAEAVVYILSTKPHVQIHDIKIRPVEQLF